MENASKALLIAGAVLIAIILISLGAVLINKSGDSSKLAENVVESMSKSTSKAIGIISNNVWKKEYGFTTPYAKFYTENIDEAKYVGEVLGLEYTLAFKTDGSAYNSWGDDLTRKSIEARKKAKDNNDTSALHWITISSNYIEDYNLSNSGRWKYEVKNDLNVHVYLNNSELGVLYLVTE